MEDYKNYKSLINKIAYNYHKQFKIDYEELKSEGNLIFVNALKMYNEKTPKCAFSNFVYGYLKSYLFEFCRKEMQQNKIADAYKQKITNSNFVTIENSYNIIVTQNNELNDIFLTFICATNEVKEMITTIFKAPVELLDIEKSNKITKNKLYKFYKKQGWGHTKIKRTFAQITNLL